jgi:hypothetical protein
VLFILNESDKLLDMQRDTIAIAESVNLDVDAYVIRNVVMGLPDPGRISVPEGFGNLCN